MSRFTIPLHILIYLLNNFWVYGTLLLTMYTLVGVATVLTAQSCLTLHTRVLQPTRLLCPWDSPGKNPGVGCHFLLQVIFPSQRLGLHLLHLLHCRQFFTTEPLGMYIHIALQHICRTFPSCMTEALTHWVTILQSFLLIALGNHDYIFCFHGFDEFRYLIEVESGNICLFSLVHFT